MNDVVVLENRVAVLENLIQRALYGEARFEERRLDPRENFAIFAGYFLLGVDPDGSVEMFIDHTLGRILQQLSRSTEQRRVEYRGKVRGKIFWPGTFKARCSEDYDPSRYVCSEVRYRYDTPENQLLKYVMTQISDCLRAIPNVLREGYCYHPANGVGILDTATRLARMEADMKRMWRNVRLREISVPQSITEQHLLQAETARLGDYAAVARLYRHYQWTALVPSRESLMSIGKKVLPLPASAGDEGEPWIQFAAEILDALIRRKDIPQFQGGNSSL